MHAYGRVDATLPKQWALPLLQVGLAAVLAAFWLLFQTGSRWVSAGFYLFGLLLGALLVSQFWTLAHGSTIRAKPAACLGSSVPALVSVAWRAPG